MSVHTILEGDGRLEDWKTGLVFYVQDGDEATEIRAVYLRNGTAGGFPAAILAAKDADGNVAIIEVSVRMFNAIARAFIGRADYEGTPIE